jgi:hypothetical protein
VHQQLAPFDAHGFWHGEAQAVAAGGADKGQADAGVAAGGLHDQGFRPNLSLPFGRLDHGPGDAVLDASQGIEKLELGQDFGPGADQGVVQAHQGGAADGGVDAVVDGHGGLLAG